MKTLNNHIILYDAECPMCTVYTKAFVSTGMLDKDGRTPYQQATPTTCPNVDMRRAVNEIALVDKTTGEVTYGIKSLFKIIGNAIPVFKPLFSFVPFIWVMSKVYAFVSYNRRVIIPPTNAQTKSALQPGTKLHYRILYLVVTVLLTSLVLSKYSILFQNILPNQQPYRELMVCGGQILFQGIIISILDKESIWDYLGNMMTISFGGALLLLPVLLLSKFITLPEIVYIGYFLLVAGLMLAEHIRRCHVFGYKSMLSATWVLYRLGVLLLII